MRLWSIWHLVTVAGLAVPRDSARAQNVSVGAQAIAVVTRADPTATRRVLTEAYLTQPVVMGHASWRALRAIGTLDLEGLTLERGELNTGAYGEGYVDRRHPHTYAHELLVGVDASRGSLRGSVFFGRGFVPFGSDDPMTRPIEKYPVNHHLSQVLERLLAVVAVRRGPVLLEGATFGGDEPTSPTDMPRWNRFGDSWATRFTVLPLAGAEIAASYAKLISPELPAGRGLDHEKWSVVGRVDRRTVDTWRYGLAEWARTDELDRGVLATRLSTLLVEGAYCRAGVVAAARLERTDRPEEEMGLDPFRPPRPHIDLSNLGVTRWTTITVSVSSPPVVAGTFVGRPFAEVARVAAAHGDPPGLFDAELRYGSSRMWMLSVGVRLRAGFRHDRMGRYGAALPSGVHDGAGTESHGMESHSMASTTSATQTRCSL
jgi:hypothetical protein